MFFEKLSLRKWIIFPPRVIIHFWLGCSMKTKPSSYGSSVPWLESSVETMPSPLRPRELVPVLSILPLGVDQKPTSQGGCHIVMELPPIAGWLISWKIPIKNGWFEGVPLFLQTSSWCESRIKSRWKAAHSGSETLRTTAKLWRWQPQ